MAYDVVGKSTKRERIIDKVTGAQKYVCDRNLSGILYVRLLRSEHARAKILKMDLTEALSLGGVITILTSDRLPSPVPKFGSVECDQPLLACGEVKYHGEPVAAVVAVSDSIACEALALIKVEYEPLPAVCSIEEALAEGAPCVHQRGEYPSGSLPNVYNQWNFGWGDVDGKEKDCSLVLHNTYYYPMVYQFAIENYACVAAPDSDGVAIWTPIQHPFILQRVVAKCLRLPFSKVRVIAEEIGGAFGGKGYPKLEPIAAYIAIQLKRPVKIQCSMEDGFFSARRTSARVDITTGFNEGGHIVFQDIRSDYLMGAYADAAPRLIKKASYLCCGPYRTPNIRMKTRAIYSNTVPATAFRGFGMPQLVLALESQMNEAANCLGLDAMEIRRRNLPHKGEVLIPGDLPVDGNWNEVLDKAAELLCWSEKTKAYQGKGIAIGIKSGIHGSTSHALVRLHSDGSVTVCAGTTDMGQGARTVLAQIAAEKLGLGCEAISVILGDTGAVPYDLSTAGSRSTVCMGTAVADACEDISNQVKDIAAELYETDSSQIRIDKGSIRVEDREISYQELMTDYFGENQGDIIGRGTFRGKKVRDHPLGGQADFWEFVIMGADINVDPDTGSIAVGKLVCVSDIGKVINPLMAEGQEEGGSVMGLGQALMEKVVCNEEGRVLNGNPLDYCIPTIKDIPLEMVSWFVENQDGPGPYGSKGLGESSAIPVGPLISGALYNAAGILFRELPMTAEKVYFALKNKQSSGFTIEKV